MAAARAWEIDHASRRYDGRVDGEEDAEASEGTLGSNQLIGDDDSKSSNRNNGAQADGGEKGDDGEPPRPVGFWHKDLAKTRMQVFGLWARTSE